MADQPDPLDDLLRPRPIPADDRLRQTVLFQTTRLLRRRRIRKRLLLALAMAACYAAGVLTMRFAMPPATPANPNIPGQVRVPRQRKPVSDASQKRSHYRRPATAPEDALALEWRAIDNAAKRAELYHRAGDRYLEESNDIPSALRCYRGALAAGARKDWKIRANDNWLMMIAKQEYQKEESDAQSGG
jgi:hypothetical protein